MGATEHDERSDDLDVLSDETLIRRSSENQQNTAAREALAQRLRDKIRRIAEHQVLTCRGYPKDQDPREFCNDVIQEVWLKADGAIDAFRGDAQLDTWLHRLVENTIIDLIRKHKGRGKSGPRSFTTIDSEEPYISTVHVGPTDIERSIDAKLLIERLFTQAGQDSNGSSRSNQIIELRVVYGHSGKELAAKYDTTQDAIHQTFSRDIRRHRDLLAKLGLTLDQFE